MFPVTQSFLLCHHQNVITNPTCLFMIKNRIGKVKSDGEIALVYCHGDSLLDRYTNKGSFARHIPTVLHGFLRCPVLPSPLMIKQDQGRDLRVLAGGYSHSCPAKFFRNVKDSPAIVNC